MTSTCRRGTKWIAESVIPASLSVVDRYYMSVHVLTDWNVGIRSNGELFHNTLRMNLCRPEMPSHLSRSRLVRPVGSSDLDTMVLCLIRSDVCCDWAILPATKTRSDMSEPHTTKAKRTWRTVTGTLTPLSSYMLVIPRFRPMRPVRVETGVYSGRGKFRDSRAEVPDPGRRRRTP